jgi:hypothetical protein
VGEGGATLVSLPTTDLDREGEGVRHLLNAVADAAVLTACELTRWASIAAEDLAKIGEDTFSCAATSFPSERTRDALMEDC